MATVEETLITGRKYRVWDAVNSIWKRVSYWTRASDVEFSDGLNAEDEIKSVSDTFTERCNSLDNRITTVNNTLQQNINNEASARSTADSKLIPKANLVFTLSGNDLYITKTY